jgi:hypothetical protein
VIRAFRTNTGSKEMFPVFSTENMMTRSYLQDLAVEMEIILKLKLKTRDYCDFGRCPSSGILKKSKEHNISETGSFSALRGRWGG